MKKTDTFFVISNYKTDPEDIVSYSDHFLIYDQTPDREFQNTLKEKYGKNLIAIKNTGHNISDYFQYVIDHYDSLPQTIMFTKGNMIGRHVDREYFERVYQNKKFTPLYNDKNYQSIPYVSSQLFEGAFLEVNNSWYMKTKPHQYFSSYDSMLSFIFQDVTFSEWTVFSPGACYIVQREQVLAYSKNFYHNLLKVVDYCYFPAEAYIIERMFYVIWVGNYKVNPYMNSLEEFQFALLNHKKIHDEAEALNSKFSFKRNLNWIFQKIATRIKYKLLKLAYFIKVKENV